MAKAFMATDFSDDDFDFRCEKRTTQIFGRLHSLLQAGYVVDRSAEDDEAFWLRHSSDKLKHNLLIIYPSGRVLSLKDDSTGECDFDLDDEAQFRRFLHQIPRPTWWDRSREWRLTSYGYVLLALFFGGVWILVSLGEWVLKSIGRSFGVL
ncbi:hypothetical protein [Bradyrhizobium sp. RT9a]|uniref:hypothetical protein n=1 Tax=Bradyrhizobium sp. RT9a TaxID=3156384 RepID=UPI003396F618